MRVREIALRLLAEYEERGVYVNLSLHSHLADGLTREERAHLTQLLYTTVEHKLTFDYYIGALAERSPESLLLRTRNLLRLGMAQILYMDSIPDFAAVNETVKLGANVGERKILNAVLRRVVKEKNSLPLPPREKNLARHLSVKYSVAPWIVKECIGVYGAGGAEAQLSHINERAPLTLAVNTLRISRDEYFEKLQEMGIRAEKTTASPFGIRVYTPTPPKQLYGFSEGHFYVQDEASQISALTLGALHGERVIDVCSAPGGKSMLSAILMKNEGEIFAYDLHESKLSLIEGSASRLGLDCIVAAERDATVPNEALIGTADRVIADVPCSGLGVLRKKPDLRYRTEEGLSELQQNAYDILKASVAYLKAGGVLVYSTCTIRREENEDVVLRFLSENAGYALPHFAVGEHSAESGMLRLDPVNHGTDGFFVAKIRKDGAV